MTQSLPFELFVAFRYLKAKRKGLFAGATALIGIIGVCVGVAALITTLSVMNGFQTDIEKKIIGAQAHMTIYGLGQSADIEGFKKIILSNPHVKAVAPFVIGQAILTYDHNTSGIILKGLDPASEFKVNDLGKKLREGSWKGLDDNGKIPGIVLGEELARNVGAWVGDQVVLVSPKEMTTAIGLVPKMQKFKVLGLLHTGYYEYDSMTAYTNIPAASAFFGLKTQATGLEARLDDIALVSKVAEELRQKLGFGAVVRTYAQMNQTLFSALKLEKFVMFLILVLIVLVASLNIASTLIVHSVEKTRDIGILKAMGATPRQIRRIFLAEGLIIGAFGIAMGLLLGFTLCYVIVHYPIVKLPSDIYYLSRVPVDIQAMDVMAVSLVGILLAALATLYPARKASLVDPVEAIHYG